MKNYDDIMKEFEKAYEKCPDMPESLSKENIVKKIKENNVEQKPKKSGFGIEMIAAAVAVVAVIGNESFSSTRVANGNDVLKAIRETEVRTCILCFVE